MTNEISNEIRKLLDNSGVIVSDDLISSQDSIPRIGLKGKKFRYGEDVLGETLDIIILDISPRDGYNKAYYEKGYTPGSTESPDCSSSNGIVPDKYITSPINVRCFDCEMNQWGSATSMSGGKAKACKDSKRLSIIKAEDLGKDDAIVFMLIITVLSLKSLTNYSKLLSRENIPSPAMVITKLSFDDDQSVPMVLFENLGMMKPDNCKISIIKAGDVSKENKKMIELSKSNVKQLDHKSEVSVIAVKEVSKSNDPLKDW